MRSACPIETCTEHSTCIQRDRKAREVDSMQHVPLSGRFCQNAFIQLLPTCSITAGRPAGSVTRRRDGGFYTRAAHDNAYPLNCEILWNVLRAAPQPRRFRIKCKNTLRPEICAKFKTNTIQIRKLHCGALSESFGVSKGLGTFGKHE